MSIIELRSISINTIGMEVEIIKIWNTAGMDEKCRALNIRAFKEYNGADPKRTYRDGPSPLFLNYLLLDASIIGNVSQADFLSEQVWKSFLRSIFYIGKGLYDRPLKHFEKTRDYSKGRSIKLTGVMRKILSLWNNHGVYIVRIFKWSMSEAAHTREKLLVKALCPCTLSNDNPSLTYYGVTEREMSQEDKQLLGSFLLKKAMRYLQKNLTLTEWVHAGHYISDEMTDDSENSTRRKQRNKRKATV